MMTEMIVSLIVFAMLLTAFAASLNGFKKFNHIQLLRQHCISAAQATLDSITATGSIIREADSMRLWPDVVIYIEQTEGKNQWKGLKLVTVTAKTVKFRKNTEVRLSRYFSNTVVLENKGMQPSPSREQ